MPFRHKKLAYMQSRFDIGHEVASGHHILNPFHLSLYMQALEEGTLFSFKEEGEENFFRSKTISDPQSFTHYLSDLTGMAWYAAGVLAKQGLPIKDSYSQPDKKEFLIALYLACSCLCYVEYFDSQYNRVSKLITKSEAVFDSMKPYFSPQRSAKTADFFKDRYTTTLSEIENERLRVISFELEENGLNPIKSFQNVWPESSVFIPWYILHYYAHGITDLLKKGIFRLTYRSAIGEEKHLVTSLDQAFLVNWFPSSLQSISDRVHQLEKNVAQPFELQFLKLPDLNVSGRIEKIPTLEILNVDPL